MNEPEDIEERLFEVLLNTLALREYIGNHAYFGYFIPKTDTGISTQVYGKEITIILIV